MLGGDEGADGVGVEVVSEGGESSGLERVSK
jgi:hypothetical protein